MNDDVTGASGVRCGSTNVSQRGVLSLWALLCGVSMAGRRDFADVTGTETGCLKTIPGLRGHLRDNASNVGWLPGLGSFVLWPYYWHVATRRSARLLYKFSICSNYND